MAVANQTTRKMGDERVETLASSTASSMMGASGKDVRTCQKKPIRGSVSKR